MSNNPKLTEGDDENSVAINLSQIEENCLSSNHSAKIILNQGITIGSLCTTCKLLIEETLYQARLSRDQQNCPTLLSYPEQPTASKPVSSIINPESTEELNELLNELDDSCAVVGITVTTLRALLVILATPDVVTIGDKSLFNSGRNSLRSELYQILLEQLK